MLRTWSFWKTFVTTYLALVAGIWGFVEIYDHYENDFLKELLGSNWWILYFIVPLFIAILHAVWRFSGEGTPPEAPDPHSRRVMLKHMDSFWIKGVLERSLHGAALLELGIKEDPGAIDYPWTIKREATNETLPAGKSMFEIFEEIGAGRSLLILGAPGSGKTTMLLELARQLIERARGDGNEPIPVVFNLSSWTEKQKLADWLVDQLNVMYYVPRYIGSEWVSENKMFLLLDGLDEVRQESRTKCVEAINHFRKEHGLTSLVVCSRLEEYSSLLAKLSLDGAIIIQPLTAKQINVYFSRFGRKLSRVKDLLSEDEALQELAKTPLMLSIMAIVYKDTKLEKQLLSRSTEELRKNLFETYIERMLERKYNSKYSQYKSRDVLHWLSWLSSKMVHHNQISFMVESLNPDWLDNNKWKPYYFISIMTTIRVLLGLIFALIFGLLFSDVEFGVIMGVVIGVVADPRTVEFYRLNWAFSWKNAIYGFVWGIVNGFRTSLLIVVMVTIFVWLGYGLNIAINIGLKMMLFSWTLSGISGFIGRLRRIEQISDVTYPSQGIRQSLRHGLNVFILSWVGVGIFFWLFTFFFFSMFYEAIGEPEPVFIMDLGFIRFGILLGLVSAISLGMFFGGSAFMHHILLRTALVYNNCIPFKLIDFLDYATDLLFLRRVGGSYIFVHRLLMEHFAEMDVGKP